MAEVTVGETGLVETRVSLNIRPNSDIIKNNAPAVLSGDHTRYYCTHN